MEYTGTAGVWIWKAEIGTIKQAADEIGQAARLVTDGSDGKEKMERWLTRGFI